MPEAEAVGLKVPSLSGKLVAFQGSAPVRQDRPQPGVFGWANGLTAASEPYGPALASVQPAVVFQRPGRWIWRSASSESKWPPAKAGVTLLCLLEGSAAEYV
jgi:hypothetical protein